MTEKNNKEKKKDYKNFLWIAIIFLLLFSIINLYLTTSLTDEIKYESEFKLIKLNNTNGFYYNVEDYMCSDTVKVSDLRLLGDDIYFSTWKGDDTGLGARYGECFVEFKKEKYN